MNRIQVLLVLLTFLFFSCEKNDTNGTGHILLRVKNSSQLDYTNVAVNTRGGTSDFGTIAAGQVSPYKSFDYTYSYGFVELQVNCETFSIQPIDYVGETKLTSGNYTYEISFNETENDQFNKLSLTFVED